MDDTFAQPLRLVQELDELADAEVERRIVAERERLEELYQFRRTYNGQMERSLHHTCTPPPAKDFTLGERFRCDCGKRWIRGVVTNPDGYRRKPGWIRPYFRSRWALGLIPVIIFLALMVTYPFMTTEVPIEPDSRLTESTPVGHLWFAGQIFFGLLGCFGVAGMVRWTLLRYDWD